MNLRPFFLVTPILSAMHQSWSSVIGCQGVRAVVVAPVAAELSVCVPVCVCPALDGASCCSGTHTDPPNAAPSPPLPGALDRFPSPRTHKKRRNSATNLMTRCQMPLQLRARLNGAAEAASGALRAAGGVMSCMAATGSELARTRPLANWCHQRFKHN